MKNAKRKIAILTIAVLNTLFLSLKFYINTHEEKVDVSKIGQVYSVVLGKNNANISMENGTATIEKYNGNAGEIVIDKEAISSNTVKIDYGAFAECNNLDTILIDKTMISEDIKIDEFEVDETYTSDQYVKYVNTKPYSEAYKQYLSLTEEEKRKTEVIPNKYSVSISALYSESMEKNYKVSEIASEETSKNFDLRDYIDIKVENQQDTGICYAFASLNAIETNLALLDNVNVDLSEVHMAALTTGFGGNFISDTEEYYSDKIGPVYEEDWPIADIFATNKNPTTIAIYNYLRGSTTSLSSSIQAILKQTKATKYVAETVNFPDISRSNPSYNESTAQIVRKIIKKHIMQYGSVYASISSSALTTQNGYAVLNTPSRSYIVDHAISIVGWDDNFSKENFPTGYKPANDGAYLALNSWGESWGNSGYFWISYEDYWAESEMRGVISVDGSISLTSMEITDTNANKKIESKIITKGINANIEINTTIGKVTEEQMRINIISSFGEDVTNLISILGNKIENKNGKMLLNIDTTMLEVGEYTINLMYGDETLPLKIEIVEGEIKGEGWYYVPEEAKLYILENREDKTYDYLKYNIHAIELKEPVESVLEYQFLGYSNIEEIILPASLARIEKGAFYGCRSLKEITIPKGVTSIEYETFCECTSLKTVTMLSEIVSVGDYAFYNCSSLDTIEISKGIANTGLGAFMGSTISSIKIAEGYIQDYAFERCTNLKKVDILDGVTGIGYGAFYECEDLETLNLGKMTGGISDYAFTFCTSLKSINIPSGVTSIGYAAFAKGGLQNITVGGGKIGEFTFAENDSLENISIKSDVISIGEACFSKCSSLTNVYIEEGITSIGDYAFQNCTFLKNINIPKSLSKIGYAAFNRCKNLSNLEIPETVTNIGNFAFAESVTYIEIKSGTLLKEEIPNIIRRATTSGDILNCSGRFTISNAQFNADYSKLTIPENVDVITMTISNGKLNGLTIVANVVHRTITYSEENWTTNDVTATLNLEQGDTVTNNNGQNTYAFTKNGEFEFQYTNANGVKGRALAKVENIDKDKPEVKVTGIPTEYTEENITLAIEATDELSGLAEEPYSFDGGKTWQSDNIKTYEDNAEGIIIQVRDMLGNTYTHEEINITQIRRLEGIKVTTQPIKTEYSSHENFDEQGMIVELSYSNKTSEPITNYTILNENDLTCQVEKIIIQYNENIEIKTELDIKVAHDIQESTCTEDGKCKIEGCTYREDAKGHDYKATVTAPTCTEQGYTTHECTRCEKEYVDTYTEALGHSFTNYTSNNDATCTEDGTKTAKCDRCDETHTITDEGTMKEHSYENGQCTGCGQEEPKIAITSSKYEIAGEFINKVLTQTKVEDLVRNLVTTNVTEVKVLDKKNEEVASDKMVGTGMSLVLKSEYETRTLKLVVTGDVTGDGASDFKDIVAINRHRLNKKVLEGEYLIAGDVTGDGKVDFKDIVKINRFRLNKITQLFSIFK